MSARGEEEPQQVCIEPEHVLLHLAEDIEAFWDEHETSVLTDPEGRQTILRDEPPAFVVWALGHLGNGDREQ